MRRASDWNAREVMCAERGSRAARDTPAALRQGGGKS